jgi:hypothetical protein
MVPEGLDHLLPSQDSVKSGGVAPKSLGFVSPERMRDCSPALQRQISLLTADEEADYFLFDESGQQVRFEIQETLLKMMFRMSRSMAWTRDQDTQASVENMAQYLIKVMGHKSGLSRESILRQFDSEYGGDTETKLDEFVRKSKGQTHDGETVLEMMHRTAMTAIPLL